MNYIKYYSLYICFLFPLFLGGQVIQKIEPPNWWIGMKEKRLQIMVYGDNIGHLQAAVKYKGIKVLKTESPQNSNYLFIDLEISDKTKPGLIPILLSDKKALVKTIEYPMLAREYGSSERQGFNTEDVIYLVTPDRFANGDYTNDVVRGTKEGHNRALKNSRHGGDIEGMRQNLDYIANLGITAIWSNPLLENDMPLYSYHGYAITDFYKTDPRFGTNESYKKFCQEARTKGIKIIMDMVVNHCGSMHWWMSNPPMKDWINYYGKPYIETNHIKTLQMDPYASAEDLTRFEDGWFVKTMPDLNVRNPWMATYLIQNSIWWIEYAGLGGIRMDTYFYPNADFMSNWSKRVMEEYPNFNIAGEVWYDKPAIVSFWQRGKENRNGYASYLPSLFDFPINSAMVKALTTPESGDQGWKSLYEMLAQDFQYADPKQMVVFPDNHDMPRIFTQLGDNISKLKMAIVFNLTMRGIPQLYYGTEVLMKSPANRDDGLIRSDFPGGWKNDSINVFTKQGLSYEQADMLQFVQALLVWRKGATAIHHGQTTHFVPENGVYVLFRYDEQQKFMIILNKNETKTTLQLDRFRRMIGNSSTGYEILTGGSIDLQDGIELTHPGPLIIQIKS